MTEPQKSTSDRLAEALEAEGAPAAMIEQARAGHYDDFRSPLDFPIRQLVEDARDHGLLAIALAAINGDFDATGEEAQAWAQSADGRATFKAFSKGRNMQGRNRKRGK